MLVAGAGGGNRAEIERRLIERSLEDESLRRRLLADPKGALEEELGSRLPDNIEVRAVRGDRGYHLPGASQRLAGGRGG